MKLRFTILIFINIISISMQTIANIEKTTIIIASIKKWLHARSQQDDAEKSILNSKKNPDNADNETLNKNQKKKYEELENAKKNEAEKRRELKQVLKVHCANKASKVFRQVKNLEKTNRENGYNSDNPIIYKCTKNIEDEIKLCECNQPTLWGKIENFFSHQ